jgi:hypothetical protein
MFRFARKVAFELSSDESRTWLKLNHGQARPIFCWWVSILDQFTRLCTSLAKNPKYVIFFGEHRHHELPVSGHIEALGILDDAIARYRKIIQNVEAVPVTAIATAWEAHRARERNPKPDPTAPKRTPRLDDALPNPKRVRTDENVDKSGPLVYSGDQKLMPSPSLGPQERICAANARDGYACRHRDCKFIHEKDVTKWPPAAFAAWKKMVDTTPGLSWNPALVEAKVLGLKYTEQTKPFTDPSPSKK